MSKTFFPEESIFVPASFPHPPNTQYKVSIGLEDWGGTHRRVAKVQMVYDGVISGRKSPSFPLGSPDHHLVNKAINDLTIKILGLGDLPY